MGNTWHKFTGLCLFGLLSSSYQGVSESVQADGEWAIYRLADVNVTSDQIRNERLVNLSLAGVPLISARDIRSYHWKTHVFECTSKADGLLDSVALNGGSVRGVPFVV